MILDVDCRQDGALTEYYIQDLLLDAQFDANATFLYTARSSCNEIVQFTPSADVASLGIEDPVMLDMRAAQKGVVHKNTASRKVSRLAHRIGALAS